MPLVTRLLSLTVIAAVIAVPVPAAAATSSDDRVQQVGTYDYLTQPDYAGLEPLAAAINGQTLGLGTFADLDGEFVLVGGTPYRVGTDGAPTVIDPSRSTPFPKPSTSTPKPPGQSRQEPPVPSCLRSSLPSPDPTRESLPYAYEARSPIC